jgi:hypothetical protein
MDGVAFSFFGRLDAAEAAGVLRLLGGVCVGDRIVRPTVSVAATDGARAAAAHLMETLGVRRGPEGEARFPLAVIASEDPRGRTLTVELHRFMRDPEALPCLAAHFVGGVPGRLIRRLWGRWGQTVVEPTESLLEAVGAGRMRFAQFSEEVLRAGLSRAAATLGTSVSYSTEREGRGAKVVRLSFSVGAPPPWLASADEAEAPEAQAPVAGTRMPARDRAEFYGLAALALRDSGSFAGAMSRLRSLLDGSSDDCDRRLSVAAQACEARGGIAAVATALEAVVASASGADAACGLAALSSRDMAWEEGEAGPERCLAWALRAAGHCVRLGADAARTTRRLRAAVDADRDAGVLSEADGAALRAAFDALHGVFCDPGALSVARAPLTLRDQYRLAQARGPAALAETLLAMSCGTRPCAYGGESG